jgi:hypothetical protein
MFRANFCPSSGAQHWYFFTAYGIVSCCCGRQGFGERLRGTMCAVWSNFLHTVYIVPRSRSLDPCVPQQQDTIPYAVKISVLRSWRWAKDCPKHVELILEINKTVIVASRWFSILLYQHRSDIFWGYHSSASDKCWLLGYKKNFFLDIFILEDRTATLSCDISNKIILTAQQPRTQLHYSENLKSHMAETYFP